MLLMLLLMTTATQLLNTHALPHLIFILLFHCGLDFNKQTGKVPFSQKTNLGRISHSQEEQKVFWNRELFWHPQNDISEEVAYVTHGGGCSEG